VAIFNNYSKALRIAAAATMGANTIPSTSALRAMMLDEQSKTARPARALTDEPG
jgi:hypothetical protein